MAPTQACPSPYDETRRVFEATRRDADHRLNQGGDPDLFRIWALRTLREQSTRELRHAALDGVMAALDDDDERHGR